MEDVLTTLEQKVNPEHAAVLVIDIQNDFCHEDGYLRKLGLDISATQSMVPRLVQFVDEARKANVKIIFVQGIYNTDIFPDHLLKRTESTASTMKDVWRGAGGPIFIK